VPNVFPDDILAAIRRLRSDVETISITVNGDGAGTGLLARTSATKTTGSLADGGQELGTVTLAKTWMLTKVVADRACRIRLYVSTGHQAADAARGFGVDPAGDGGCMFDARLPSTTLTWHCVPNITSSDDDPTIRDWIPVTIDNQSGSTSTVSVTFTFFALEA